MVMSLAVICAMKNVPVRKREADFCESRLSNQSRWVPVG
jgi:hypothetical protein